MVSLELMTYDYCITMAKYEEISVIIRTDDLVKVTEF
jgi:hypothetical protein